MANININIRMDSDLKQQFEAFCNDVGMTMTTAFTVLRKRRSGNIESPLRLEPKFRTPKRKRQLKTPEKVLE